MQRRVLARVGDAFAFFGGGSREARHEGHEGERTGARQPQMNADEPWGGDQHGESRAADETTRNNCHFVHIYSLRATGSGSQAIYGGIVSRNN